MNDEDNLLQKGEHETENKKEEGEGREDGEKMGGFRAMDERKA